MQFIHREGRTYMEVKPVEALLRSNLIADVVKRGDVFAVDMSSGKLTILESEQKLEAKTEHAFLITTPNGGVATHSSYATFFLALNRMLLDRKFKNVKVTHTIGGVEVASVSFNNKSAPEAFVDRVMKMLQENPVNS